MVAAEFESGGERRGVLQAISAEPDAFGAVDIEFIQAAARWLGGVMHRAELVEQIAKDAAERGRQLAAEQLITVLAHDLGNVWGAKTPSEAPKFSSDGVFAPHTLQQARKWQ